MSGYRQFLLDNDPKEAVSRITFGHPEGRNQMADLTSRRHPPFQANA